MPTASQVWVSNKNKQTTPQQADVLKAHLFDWQAPNSDQIEHSVKTPALRGCVKAFWTFEFGKKMKTKEERYKRGT